MEGQDYSGDMNFNRFAEHVLVIVAAFTIIAVGTYIALRHQGIDWRWKHYMDNNQNQNQNQNGQSV